MYMAADWARGKISLLSLQRKTNKAGKISAWMKRRREEGREHLTLEDFGVDYKMQVEKIVAAQTLSRLNEKFFGQWLMLNVPFEAVRFYEPCADQLRLVPREHENCAGLDCPSIRWPCRCGRTTPPFSPT